MDFRHIRYVLPIAEHENVRKAAESFNVASPHCRSTLPIWSGGLA